MIAASTGEPPSRSPPIPSKARVQCTSAAGTGPLHFARRPQAALSDRLPAGSSGLEVLLLPPLAKDAYTDAESRPWQARLYTSFQDGKYVIRSGQLLRRRFFVRFGTCDDAANMSSWLENRLLPQAPAEYLCSTGVLGRALPAAGPQWADFEAWFQRNFERYEENCAENRSLGVMHYGDWFGERGLNYGNNEYDLPWGLAVQWMRTGHRAYFDRGLAMALHYSSIDTLHGRAAQTARGLCWEHSFNHVGTPASRRSC